MFKNFINRPSVNRVLSFLLLVSIAISVITLVNAAAPNPGHNFTESSGGIATGDIIYGSATDVFSVLADVATGNALISGGVGAAPSWGKIALTTHVSGVLPVANGGSQITVKALSAQQNSSSVTPAKVTNLDQTVGTGTYVFQYFIRYRSSAAATGVKFDVNHSGTVTSFVWNQRYSNLIAKASDSNADQDAIIAAGVTGSMFASRAKGTAGRGTTLTVDTANADMFVIIEGLMVVTVSGDLQLYFGSEATGSTQSIMQNSSLILTKIL